MLVLGMKRGDVVVINPGTPQECRVMLTEYDRSRGRVRLGFEAAREVVIHRQDVIDRIREREREEGGE